MGIRQRIEKLADAIQRWDALTGKVPNWVVVLIMGVLPSTTAIAAIFSHWTPADIWFATLGTVFVGAFGFVGVRLGLAKAEEIRRGPPPPKPEAPSLSLACVAGNNAILEVTNKGGVGEFIIRGRILKVSKGYEIPYASTFQIASSRRIRKGETITVSIADRSGVHVWVPNVHAPAVEFQASQMRGTLSFRLLIVVEQDTKEELLTLGKVAVTIGVPFNKDHLTVSVEDES